MRRKSFLFCALILFLAGCVAVQAAELKTNSLSANQHLQVSAFTYSFTNNCDYPVWIGQSAAASNGTSYPPVGGNWALAPACTANNQCGSGQSCSSGQCTCSTASDCPGEASCNNGLCATTAQFNIPQAWSSGTFWPRTQCTSPSSGKLNCATGQCTPKGSTDGLLDCGVGITSPETPVTQFEVTSTASAINYDVSNVAGFNVEMTATPQGGSFVVPGVPASQAIACYTAGCTADLNATCPDNLQVLDGTTVIGCLDPCTQCQRTSPAGLSCDSQITTDSEGNTPANTIDCSGINDGLPTYGDMYCAKNATDSVVQASSNQGTPTAFGQDDCFPGTTFVQPSFASSYALPTGQGVCLYTNPPQSGISGFNDYGWFDYPSQTTKNCGILQDGTACGGYLATEGYFADAVGYTCQTATYTDSSGQSQSANLCMPPTVSGLGDCKTNNNGTLSLYEGVGGVTNAAWLAAGTQAGDNGAAYYESFKTACGASYSWQYDDASSGFGCDVTPTSNGQPFTGFAVTFCQ